MSADDDDADAFGRPQCDDCGIRITASVCQGPVDDDGTRLCTHCRHTDGGDDE